MKKFILFIWMAGLLFAQSESDIAFTTGYNKFNDPEFLRKGRFFFGIRGGVYQDGYGFQLGYERAQGANCQGLNLDRIYANVLAISNQSQDIKPYALISAGYESSNIHRFKPSQAFIGAGIGVKKVIGPNMNGFLETRILRKLKSDDTDIITTLGLALALNSKPSYYPQSTLTQRVTAPEISPSSILVDSGYNTRQTMPQQVEIIETSVEPYIEPYVEPRQTIVSQDMQEHYYVQMIALSKSDPSRYVQKLYAKGVDNVEVKQITRRGRLMSLVVVGPFNDRTQADRNLRRLKRVSRGAFITRL